MQDYAIDAQGHGLSPREAFEQMVTQAFRRMPSESCDDIDLDRYISGESSSKERDRAEIHLTNCMSCFDKVVVWCKRRT